MVRDGRAVAYSYTTVPWWDGWAGVDRSRWGSLSEESLDTLARYDHSFVALAALQWKTLIDNISDKSELLAKEDLLVLRHEDVARDPVGAAYEASRSRVRTPRIGASRSTWPRRRRGSLTDSRPTPPPRKQNLSRGQIDMICDICEHELARFDYV